MLFLNVLCVSNSNVFNSIVMNRINVHAILWQPLKIKFFQNPNGENLIFPRKSHNGTSKILIFRGSLIIIRWRIG
jgi:hypothetical protein